MIGFAILLSFVIVLGLTAYLKTDQLHQQTEDIYQHPLKVRRALGILSNDILNMRLGIKDLMLAKSDKEKQAAIILNELAAADAEKQLSIVKEWYLGPSDDVEEAYQAYIIWETVQEENIKLALAGEIEKVRMTLLSEGAEGSHRDKMLQSIYKIDEFAINKGDALFVSSVELKDKLKKQLVLLVSALLLLSLFISYSLWSNIRKPLKEIKNTVRRFHHGDMNALSIYDYKNEFGELSSSFNEMADLIQVNNSLNEMSASLTEVMLSEYDAKEFFRTTLGALAVHIGSQMAAVYLLSDDKTAHTAQFGDCPFGSS